MDNAAADDATDAEPIAPAVTPTVSPSDGDLTTDFVTPGETTPGQADDASLNAMGGAEVDGPDLDDSLASPPSGTFRLS